jgi:hypothetical protein
MDESTNDSGRGRFADAKKAFKTVDLEYPVIFDGKEYSSITIRRMTQGDVRRYVEAAASGEDPPMPNLDCPIELLDELDADDFDRVDTAVRDFLPQRLRTALERYREAGADTQPSSPPNSDGAPTSSEDSSGETSSTGTNTP